MAKPKIKKDFPVGDIPEVEAEKEEYCYNSMLTLKAANYEMPITEEQERELEKISNDILYFCNNYVKIATNTDGVVLFNTYDFQNEFIEQMYNNRFNISMMARQMGKCVTGDTHITIRNKKTGEIREIAYEDFYKEVKQ